MKCHMFIMGIPRKGLGARGECLVLRLVKFYLFIYDRRNIIFHSQ